MRNASMMSHPMHLHGHRFQVIAITGAKRAGALRDTVLVPLGDSMTIVFYANNPEHMAVALPSPVPPGDRHDVICDYEDLG